MDVGVAAGGGRRPGRCPLDTDLASLLAYVLFGSAIESCLGTDFIEAIGACICDEPHVPIFSFAGLGCGWRSVAEVF